MNDDLLTRYLLGETNPKEDESIRIWIAAHPDHERRYRQLKTIWDTSKLLEHTSEVDVQRAWQQFRERREHLQTTGKSVFRVGYIIRAAAAVALIATLTLIGYELFLPTAIPFRSARLETNADVRQEKLADGSEITLNKYTDIRFARSFFRRSRIADLRSGEAFFEVRSDAARPFIVRSGGVTISVLGTAFNVKKSDAGTEVIVESGMVKVTAGERETVLRAGQKVTAYTANAQFEEGPAGDRLYHYYVDKQFVLTDTPLWRIIEVLEQAYDTKIVIAREELRHLRLTTTLRLGSLERNLEVITETFGITAEQQQGKWVLR